jgi:hypothetical protein
MTMAEEKTTERLEAAQMRVTSPFDEMDRLFDRLRARRGWMRPSRTDWTSLGDAGRAEPRAPAHLARRFQPHGGAPGGG